MRWIWIAITVISGSIGDVLSAEGMAREGVATHFRSPGVLGRLRYICTHRLVIAGIGANAASFISFIGLLSVAPLTFAVPVTALGYIIRTVLAKFYLHEYVNWERWAGVVLVAVGVLFIAI